MKFAKIQLNESVIKLYLEIYPEMIKDEKPNYEKINGIFGNTAQWYALIDKDYIYALCTIGIIPNYTILYNVGVDPLYRNKGLGYVLMESIVSLYGNTNIVLFVKKNNRKAISLYRKVGFEFTDTLFVPDKEELCYIRIKSKSDAESNHNSNKTTELNKFESNLFKL